MILPLFKIRLPYFPSMYIAGITFIVLLIQGNLNIICTFLFVVPLFPMILTIAILNFFFMTAVVRIILIFKRNHYCLSWHILFVLIVFLSEPIPSHHRGIFFLKLKRSISPAYPVAILFPLLFSKNLKHTLNR